MSTKGTKEHEVWVGLLAGLFYIDEQDGQDFLIRGRATTSRLAVFARKSLCRKICRGSTLGGLRFHLADGEGKTPVPLSENLFDLTDRTANDTEVVPPLRFQCPTPKVFKKHNKINGINRLIKTRSLSYRQGGGGDKTCNTSRGAIKASCS